MSPGSTCATNERPRDRHRGPTFLGRPPCLARADRRIQSWFLGGRYPTRDELHGAWMQLARATPAPIAVGQRAERCGISLRRAQVIATLLHAMRVVDRRGGKLRKVRDFASHDAWEGFLSSYERRRELDRERLQAMIAYSQTALCRVRYMREYFGEEPGGPCGHCDNCRERPGIVAEVLRAEAEASERPGLVPGAVEPP